MNSSRTFRRALSSVALLIALFTLISCAKTNKLIGEGEVLRDKKTDVEYLCAPSSYEALAVGEEPYAKQGDLLFYPVVGQDPLKFLSEEFGALFYADSVTLPTPREMSLSYAEIRLEENLLTTLEEGKTVEAIRDAYLDSDAIAYPNYTPVRNLQIRLADSELGICYVLTYLEYAENYVGDDGVIYGKAFLRNPYENRFVAAPEELIAAVQTVYGSAS